MDREILLLNHDGALPDQSINFVNRFWEWYVNRVPGGKNI